MWRYLCKIMQNLQIMQTINSSVKAFVWVLHPCRIWSLTRINERHLVVKQTKAKVAVTTTAACRKRGIEPAFSFAFGPPAQTAHHTLFKLQSCHCLLPVHLRNLDCNIGTENVMYDTHVLSHRPSFAFWCRCRQVPPCGAAPLSSNTVHTCCLTRSKRTICKP